MLYGRGGQSSEAEPPAKKHKTEEVANPNLPVAFSTPSLGSTSLPSGAGLTSMNNLPGFGGMAGMSHVPEMAMMAQLSHMSGMEGMSQMAQMTQMAQIMSGMTGTAGMAGVGNVVGTQAMAAAGIGATGCGCGHASMPVGTNSAALNSRTTPNSFTAAVRPLAPGSRRPVMPTVPPVVEKRSAEEVKEALTKLGVSTQNLQTPREFQQKLHETEAWISRAEKTKKISRFPDSRMISSFTEGLAPGSEGLLRMLEAGSDPNIVSEGAGSGFAAGMTPILAACSWGKVDEVRVLIAAGADLSARTPGIGHSALHLVAGGNFQSWGTEKTLCLLRLLLDKAPNLLEEKNSMGRTPLDHARYEKQRPQDRKSVV